MTTIDDVLARLPGFDCGRCGHSCRVIAERIVAGEATETDCEALADPSVELRINGEIIPLTEFPRAFLVGTILGAVSALKGVDEVQSLQLRVVNSPDED
jgi:hypothetical protein